MKVFFDTNVLLDVIGERQPFYPDSAAVWTLAENKKIVGMVAAISITNVYYIVRRLANKRKASAAVRTLLDVFTPSNCDAVVLRNALDAQFKDFEDAVQYFCAIEAGAEQILSRNVSHFPDSKDCPVLSPREFLALHVFE